MTAQTKREIFIEMSILGFLAYVVFFVSVNVNPTLGTIYSNPVLLAIVLGMVDYFFGSKTVKLINKDNSWGKVFLWGIAGYIAVLASSYLSSALATIIPVKELLSLLASSAPVFSNSASLNFFVFAFLVAYIETYAFFVIALDASATLFKVQLNRKNIFNPKLVLILFGLSLAFLLYHVTAKGIQAESTLILVFFMALMSLITIVYTEDARPALIIHILANAIAATSLFASGNFFSVFTLVLPFV